MRLGDGRDPLICSTRHGHYLDGEAPMFFDSLGGIIGYIMTRKVCLT